MSAVAVTVLLGLLLVLLVRVRRVSTSGAMVAVVFGLVLGTTPAGPWVHQALTSGGHWLWAQVQAL